MKNRMFGLATFSAAMITAGAAMAQSVPKPVPEISAMEGTAAIAVLVAIVLIAWERRRRAS